MNGQHAADVKPLVTSDLELNSTEQQLQDEDAVASPSALDVKLLEAVAEQQYDARSQQQQQVEEHKSSSQDQQQLAGFTTALPSPSLAAPPALPPPSHITDVFTSPSAHLNALSGAAPSKPPMSSTSTTASMFSMPSSSSPALPGSAFVYNPALPQQQPFSHPQLATGSTPGFSIPFSMPSYSSSGSTTQQMQPGGVSHTNAVIDFLNRQQQQSSAGQQQKESYKSYGMTPSTDKPLQSTFSGADLPVLGSFSTPAPPPYGSFAPDSLAPLTSATFDTPLVVAKPLVKPLAKPEVKPDAQSLLGGKPDDDVKPLLGGGNDAKPVIEDSHDKPKPVRRAWYRLPASVVVAILELLCPSRSEAAKLLRVTRVTAWHTYLATLLYADLAVSLSSSLWYIPPENATAATATVQAASVAPPAATLSDEQLLVNIPPRGAPSNLLQSERGKLTTVLQGKPSYGAVVQTLRIRIRDTLDIKTGLTTSLHGAGGQQTLARLVDLVARCRNVFVVSLIFDRFDTADETTLTALLEAFGNLQANRKIVPPRELVLVHTSGASISTAVHSLEADQTVDRVDGETAIKMIEPMAHFPPSTRRLTLDDIGPEYCRFIAPCSLKLALCESVKDGSRALARLFTRINTIWITQVALYAPTGRVPIVSRDVPLRSLKHYHAVVQLQRCDALVSKTASTTTQPSARVALKPQHDGRLGSTELTHLSLWIASAELVTAPGTTFDRYELTRLFTADWIPDTQLVELAFRVPAALTQAERVIVHTTINVVLLGTVARLIYERMGNLRSLRLPPCPTSNDFASLGCRIKSDSFFNWWIAQPGHRLFAGAHQIFP